MILRSNASENLYYADTRTGDSYMVPAGSGSAAGTRQAFVRSPTSVPVRPSSYVHVGILTYVARLARDPDVIRPQIAIVLFS